MASFWEAPGRYSAGRGSYKTPEGTRDPDTSLNCIQVETLIQVFQDQSLPRLEARCFALEIAGFLKCKHRVVLSPDGWFNLNDEDLAHNALGLAGVDLTGTGLEKRQAQLQSEPDPPTDIVLRMKQLGWHPHVDVQGAYIPDIVPRHDPFLVEAVLQLQTEGVFDRATKWNGVRVVELQSDRYALASYDGSEYLIEPHMTVSWNDHPLPEEYIKRTSTLVGWGSGIRRQLERYLNEKSSEQYCLFQNGEMVTILFQSNDFIRVTDDIGMIRYSPFGSKCMWRKRASELLPPCGSWGRPKPKPVEPANSLGPLSGNPFGPLSG